MGKHAPKGLVWHLLRNKELAAAVAGRLKRAGAAWPTFRREKDGSVMVSASIKGGYTDYHLATWIAKAKTVEEFKALPKAFLVYRASMKELMAWQTESVRKEMIKALRRAA